MVDPNIEASIVTQLIAMLNPLSGNGVVFPALGYLLFQNRKLVGRIATGVVSTVAEEQRGQVAMPRIGSAKHEPPTKVQATAILKELRLINKKLDDISRMANNEVN